MAPKTSFNITKNLDNLKVFCFLVSFIIISSEARKKVLSETKVLILLALSSLLLFCKPHPLANNSAKSKLVYFQVEKLFL
jgi:hypothetical protein